ncbi:MAG: hypothetical protein HYY31_00495 [Chloroflexi bacterium]|nr:hypothetical protein [Chloroflexota bacterium]
MEFLTQLLGCIQVRDRRVLLAPQIGADAAVLDFGPVSLVAKADPVTFATDSIGWYVVHVNANDVACLGARPRWFIATVLLLGISYHLAPPRHSLGLDGLYRFPSCLYRRALAT